MAKKVAIVGSGCSGIGALYALKNTDHEVHLYEADDRLGGHTNTVSFKKDKATTQVDTGFIVLNSATYPNFIAFLKDIGVPTVPTEMTFGVSRDFGVFEWAGTSLSAVFAQRENLLSLRFWAMIFDIFRFNQFALDLLSREAIFESSPHGSNDEEVRTWKDESIGDYLKRGKYSNGFRDDYLIPMTSAIWSTRPDKCSLDFPALTLVRFMYNHHLLTALSSRPTWMTIPGGSQQYIDAVMTDFPKDRVHISSPVTSLTNNPSGAVVLKTSDGSTSTYDHVILATHGDQALKILEPSIRQDEEAILSNFQTSKNSAVLHSDLRLMPIRREAWSAWNNITQTPSNSSDSMPSSVCLTYNMNILQHIPVDTLGDVLVTLNPIFPPSPALTQGSWSYSHPLYTPKAIRAQALLPKIQNRRGISYCGAWTKYGFHEDGFSSGAKVAIDHLGASIPWSFVDGTFIRGKRPQLTWKDYTLRVFLWYIQAIIVVVSWLIGRS